MELALQVPELPDWLADWTVGERLDWHRDGHDWPNRRHSRFVRAGGLRWHVQVAGEGPALLLLHGTGSTTHTWRDLIAPLSQHFRVVAPDLPGHGFSGSARSARSLPGVARALASLLRALDLEPAGLVGHSAGAAIACRMALDGCVAPAEIVAINGALRPPGGLAEPTYTGLARMIRWNPLIPRLLAWNGSRPDVVVRFMRGTGSRLDARGVALYGRLLTNARHVSATLEMMAHWELRPLLRDLPGLAPRLVLAVSRRDRYIPPEDAARVQERLPSAEIVDLGNLGHLAHEEQPGVVVELVCARGSKW